MVPMEGYGTDCYVTFNRLAHANSEQMPRVLRAFSTRNLGEWWCRAGNDTHMHQLLTQVRQSFPEALCMWLCFDSKCRHRA